MSTGGDGRASGSRRGRRTIVVLALTVGAVVLLAGIGAAAVMFALRGSPEQLSTRTPADADFFATAYLDPSAGQKINLERMIRQFPALGSDQQLQERVGGALDGFLASSGLATEDVRPWLGSQVAVAGEIDDAGTSFAVLIDSRDVAAAEATLEKVRAQPQVGGQDFTWSSVQRAGVTIWIGRPQFGGTPAVLAIDDGTVVLGNSVVFASDVVATIAGDAATLEDSQRFLRATASLPDDRLGLAYVNLGSVFQRLGPGLLSGIGTQASSGGSAIPDPAAIDGLGLSLSAEPAGLELDVATTVDPTKLSPQMREVLAAAGSDHGPNDTLSWVPGDAYGVFATNALREALGAGLAAAAATDPALGKLGLTGPDGVLAHLTGDAVLQVAPGTGRYPTGAIVVGTDDAEGMRAFLDRIAGQVSRLFAPTSLDALRAGQLPGGDPASAPDLKRLLNAAAQPQVPSWSSSTYEGVAIRTLDLPESMSGPEMAEFGIRPSYAVVGGAGILAVSPEAIRAMIDAHGNDDLATSASFRAALAAFGGEDDQLVYVDVDRVALAVRESLPVEDRASFDRSVAPNLQPIDAFLAGSRSTGSGSRTRVLLLIR